MIIVDAPNDEWFSRSSLNEPFVVRTYFDPFECVRICSKSREGYQQKGYQILHAPNLATSQQTRISRQSSNGAEIPSKEPEQFRAGDTIKWKRSLSDYKASESWVLKYAFRGTPGVIDITSSASGDDHLVNEVAATTAAYSPGIYDVIGFVVFHVRSFSIVPNRTVSGGLDGVKSSFFIPTETSGSPSKPQSGPKAGPKPVFVAQASSEMLFAPGGLFESGGPCRIRTCDQGIMSPLL